LGTSSEARNNSAERSNSGERNYSEERSKSASRNNSVAADSATRSGRTAARSNFNGHTAERHNAENWHREWDRQRSHYSDGRYYVYEDGYWYGTDDGSYSYGSDSGSSADAESNDNNSNGYNSNDNNEAVSKDIPAPDPTVTAVQTKLTQLGYYNGAIDGIYGPTTRDAVANYQIAAKLTVTGSLSADTLKSLGLPQGTRG
jgi:His-Xaa-Ser repeat protein HxsA